MNDFTPRLRSSFMPRRRATVWQGRLMLPPPLVNPHQREYLPEQLTERARTFGQRLATLNAGSQRRPAIETPDITTVTDPRRSSLSDL